ncbi:T9SS C-terminal target domain-containing protein [Sphingobacteriales bacterium UPWRP_1]|nr:hypothetical protein BVG80_08875 [Sphingobacteriales bacterium TSM_CSM]PSJ72313.1 T9SS C-terminal target domain-containing protein [Sphingobacteriales bacterium UPWRP_1]
MKASYILLFFILSVAANAQTQLSWSIPIAVANTDFGFYRPHIALSENEFPVVLWGNGATAAIYVSQWQPAGFTTPTRVNPEGTEAFTSNWAGPDFAATDTGLFVVYKQLPEETSNLWIAHSYNNGQSFLPPIDVDAQGFVSRFPTVTIDINGNPLVGFMKFDSGWDNPRWAVTRSADAGFTFLPDVPAGDYSGGEACDCCPGNIVMHGNTVAMQYRDNLDNLREMWTGISTDGGVSFPTGAKIDDTHWIINQCPSSGPDGYIVNDTLYSVFMSKASGKNRVYYSALHLPSKTLAYSQTFTQNAANLLSQNYPRTAQRGQVTATVWEQRVNNGKQIMLACNTGNLYPMNFTLDTLAFSTNNSAFENPDVVISDHQIHVVWQDNLSQTVKYVVAEFEPPVISSTPAPNPSLLPIAVWQSDNGNELYITLPNSYTHSNTQIQILNLAGNVLGTYSPNISNNTQEISMANWASGIYVCAFYQNGKLVQSRQFIKR